MTYAHEAQWDNKYDGWNETILGKDISIRRLIFYLHSKDGMKVAVQESDECNYSPFPLLCHLFITPIARKC